MSDINTGRPAFPQAIPEEDGSTTYWHGLHVREYAAIKLRVPNSGTNWLDEMITQSLRDECAAKAMQGILNNVDAEMLFDTQYTSLTGMA